jgi:hypothetical protein
VPLARPTPIARATPAATCATPPRVVARHVCPMRIAQTQANPCVAMESAPPAPTRPTSTAAVPTPIVRALARSEHAGPRTPATLLAIPTTTHARLAALVFQRRNAARMRNATPEAPAPRVPAEPRTIAAMLAIVVRINHVGVFASRRGIAAPTRTAMREMPAIAVHVHL